MLKLVQLTLNVFCILPFQTCSTAWILALSTSSNTLFLLKDLFFIVFLECFFYDPLIKLLIMFLKINYLCLACSSYCLWWIQWQTSFKTLFYTFKTSKKEKNPLPVYNMYYTSQKFYVFVIYADYIIPVTKRLNPGENIALKALSASVFHLYSSEHKTGPFYSI